MAIFQYTPFFNSVAGELGGGGGGGGGVQVYNRTEGAQDQSVSQDQLVSQTCCKPSLASFNRNTALIGWSFFCAFFDWHNRAVYW